MYYVFWIRLFTPLYYPQLMNQESKSHYYRVWQKNKFLFIDSTISVVLKIGLYK